MFEPQESATGELDFSVVPTAADEVLRHLHPLLAGEFSHKAYLLANSVTISMHSLVQDENRLPGLNKPRILLEASGEVLLGSENSLDARKAFKVMREPLETFLTQSLQVQSSDDREIVTKSWAGGRLQVTHITRERLLSRVLHYLGEFDRGLDELIGWFEVFREFLQDETNVLSVEERVRNKRGIWSYATDRIYPHMMRFGEIKQDYPTLFQKYSGDTIRKVLEQDREERLSRLDVPVPKVRIKPAVKPPPRTQEETSKIPFRCFSDPEEPDEKQHYEATLESIDIISPNTSHLIFSFVIIPGSPLLTYGFSVECRLKSEYSLFPTSTIHVVGTAPKTAREFKNFTSDKCNPSIELNFPAPDLVEWHFRRKPWHMLTGTRLPQRFNLSLDIQHESDFSVDVTVTVVRRPFLIPINDYQPHYTPFPPIIMEIPKEDDSAATEFKAPEVVALPCL
ncbi:hypothetical protein CVT24_000138 [Panaeolus cyanescens]|uniref:Uncharacterized protein n=1 Tax=Panaeolus cyanescens TaxID=181874 RepID=A0A409VS52_9AGAR|nr:hypothetical protein CVT24_000138 [Panaeolus cyanescens]